MDLLGHINILGLSIMLYYVIILIFTARVFK